MAPGDGRRARFDAFRFAAATADPTWYATPSRHSSSKRTAPRLPSVSAGSSAGSAPDGAAQASDARPRATSVRRRRRWRWRP